MSIRDLLPRLAPRARAETSGTARRRIAAAAVVLGLAGSMVAVAGAAPASAAVKYKEFMSPDVVLFPGDKVISAKSPSGSHDELEMQFDGNLVLYHYEPFLGPVYPVWATNTQGKGNYLKLNGADGVLSLHNARGATIWVGARVQPFSWLKVQWDDKIVLYSGPPWWVPEAQTCEWDRRSPTLPLC